VESFTYLGYVVKGKKVKLSHYRPKQALGVPGGSGSRISRQSAHEGGKVQTYAPAVFTPRNLDL
jgi:hypothetical protein